MSNHVQIWIDRHRVGISKNGGQLGLSADLFFPNHPIPSRLSNWIYRSQWYKHSSLCMKSLALIIMTLLMISTADAGEKLAFSVVELPRPNSGTFSFAEAEARRSEILSNAPSPRLESWKNPYMGFCIHIGKDDSVTVYNHWLKALPDFGKSRPNQSVAEIKKLIAELPLEGNPAGVLVSSDAPLRNSKTIHKMMEVLFVPSVQLFYVTSSEPDGAANGSQPIRSETNGTSSAAGSRR